MVLFKKKCLTREYLFFILCLLYWWWGGGGLCKRAQLCEIHNLKYSHKKKIFKAASKSERNCTVTMTATCSASPSYTQYRPHKQNLSVWVFFCPIKSILTRSFEKKNVHLLSAFFIFIWWTNPAKSLLVLAPITLESELNSDNDQRIKFPVYKANSTSVCFKPPISLINRVLIPRVLWIRFSVLSWQPCCDGADRQQTPPLSATVNVCLAWFITNRCIPAALILEVPVNLHFQQNISSLSRRQNDSGLETVTPAATRRAVIQISA